MCQVRAKSGQSQSQIQGQSVKTGYLLLMFAVSYHLNGSSSRNDHTKLRIQIHWGTSSIRCSYKFVVNINVDTAKGFNFNFVMYILFVPLLCQTLRPPLQKCLFPVQRVAEIVAIWAAAKKKFFFFFFLLRKF